MPSFFMFSINSVDAKTDLGNEKSPFENVFKISKDNNSGTISAESINGFFNKYPKLKKYQKDVEDLYKKRE